MRYLRLVCPDGIEKTGYRIEGNRLEPPPRQAPTVRVWKGKALTTDGPFAETKEQVGVTNVSSTLDAGLDGLRPR